MCLQEFKNLILAWNEMNLIIILTVVLGVYSVLGYEACGSLKKQIGVRM